MRPVMDNLEQLLDANEEERYTNEIELKSKIDELFDRNIIQTEALNFIRGRSFLKTYLIIDEAQNMTLNQAKSINYPCRQRHQNHFTWRPKSNRQTISR